MHRISVTIVLFAALLAPLVAQAEANVYELRVDGLACPFCAYGIEKKLSRIEGVEKIDVELKSGVVIVTMAEGAALAEEVAHKAVKEAGFTLRAFAPRKKPK